MSAYSLLGRLPPFHPSLRYDGMACRTQGHIDRGQPATERGVIRAACFVIVACAYAFKAWPPVMNPFLTSLESCCLHTFPQANKHAPRT